MARRRSRRTQNFGMDKSMQQMMKTTTGLIGLGVVTNVGMGIVGTVQKKI